MIHRIIDTIRQMNHRSGFEAYLENVQRGRADGAPTITEAKRDYEAIVQGKDGAVGTVKPDSGGMFLYGWHTFNSSVGADVGDVIRATFDVLSGSVSLEVGGTELLSD